MKVTTMKSYADEENKVEVFTINVMLDLNTFTDVKLQKHLYDEAEKMKTQYVNHETGEVVPTETTDDVLLAYFIREALLNFSDKELFEVLGKMKE